MDKPLFNRITEHQINAYIKNPGHSLLLIGPSSRENSIVLNWIAGRILDLQPKSLDKYPYILRLNLKDEKITIDSVREIEHFLSLSVPGVKSAISRLILINNADGMLSTAQNALLKNIEEPPLDTVFMMSASDTNLILPTVISRSSIIRLTNPDREDIIRYLKDQGMPDEVISRSIAISGGSIISADEIARDPSTHPMSIAANQLKQILQSNTTERLVMVNQIVKNPELMRNILILARNISIAGISSNKQISHWERILQTTYQTQTFLDNKSNSKLAMTYFMIHLSSTN